MLNNSAKQYIAAFCLLLAVGVPAVMAACPGNRATIKVGWETWPPYQYVNVDGLLTGVDIEMATIVMADLQCKIEFIEIPWKRHLKELASGTVDVALGASINEERQEYAYFSTPYRQELNSLFVRKDSRYIDVNSLEEFFRQQGQIGLSLGYYYGEDLSRLIEKPTYKQQVTYVRDNSQLYQMLEKRRISGFVADTLTVAQEAKIYREILDFRPVLLVNSSHIYMMLSKKSVPETYVVKLNRTLEKLKNNGRLYEVVSRYALAEHKYKLTGEQ